MLVSSEVATEAPEVLLDTNKNETTLLGCSRSSRSELDFPLTSDQVDDERTNDRDETGTSAIVNTVNDSNTRTTRVTSDVTLGNNLDNNRNDVNGFLLYILDICIGTSNHFGMLIDTGAEISLIKRCAWENLPATVKTPRRETRHTVRGMEGRTIRTYGQIVLRYTLTADKNSNDEPIWYEGTFVIIDDTAELPTPLLIGTDQLKDRPWLLSFDGHLVIHPDQCNPSSPMRRIKLRTNNQRYIRLSRTSLPPESDRTSNDGQSDPQTAESGTVHGSMNTEVKIESVCTIPPWTTQLLTAAVNEPCEGRDIVIDPTRHQDCLYIARTLDTVNRGHCRVQVTNVGSANIVIQPNQVLTTGSFPTAGEITSPDLSTPGPLDDVASPPLHVRYVDSSKLDETELRKHYQQILSTQVCADEISSVLHDTSQCKRLMDFLVTNRDVIAIKDDKLGQTPLTTFEINVPQNTRPIYTPPYRIPHSQQKVIDELVDSMLNDKIIEPSVSPWASPLILVRKKDGTYRPCVDYRKLNSCTTPDRFPIPNLTEILQKLGRAKVFTTLDLKSGYYQMKLEPDSKKYTAFSTPSGHFEYNVLPFGLKNGPAKFSRLMDIVLTGLLGTGALVYLDDIMVYSENVESHYVKLEQVFSRLRRANLKLKLEKCQFFRQSLVYLGYLVTTEGLKPDPAKVSTLENYPPPTSVEEARSFVGLAGYYRQMIPGFSHLAAPITNLFKKNVVFEWSPECHRAFQEIIRRLITYPVIRFPDFSKPFIISTDASGYGIGAVLSQRDDEGVEHPISFASRLLSKAERNYPVIEREALGVVWALAKFRTMVYGYELDIRVDHQPLTSLFKDKTLEGKLSRWALKVAEYNATITYRPGRLNTVPDCLSRLPAAKVRVVKTTPTLTLDDIRIGQQNDPEIVKMANQVCKLYRDGILYHRRLDQTLVPVLPKPLIHDALTICHDFMSAGHTGYAKTLDRLRRRYYFDDMLRLTKEFCEQCPSCRKHKGSLPPPHPPYRYPLPTRPWTVIHIDIAGPLKTTDKGHKYILVAVDALTRYCEVMPLLDRSATAVASALVHNIILRHSTPSVIVSDNAAEFTSKLLREVCSLCKINKVQITPRHPASNGLAERHVGKVVSYLRHVVNRTQNDWDVYLPWAQLAINSTPNDTLGDSPHYVLYHYDCRLPLDPEDTDIPTELPHVAEYSETLSKHATWILDEAKRHLTTELERQHRVAQNRHRAARPLKLGQMCYVNTVKPPGKGLKFYPKWKGPYRVVSDLGRGRFLLKDLATFNTVTVHRDHVKPVSEVPPPTRRQIDHYQSLPPDLRDLPMPPIDDLRDLPIPSLDELPDWNGIYKIRIPTAATGVPAQAPTPVTPDRNQSPPVSITPTTSPESPRGSSSDAPSPPDDYRQDPTYHPPVTQGAHQASAGTSSSVSSSYNLRPRPAPRELVPDPSIVQQPSQSTKRTRAPRPFPRSPHVPRAPHPPPLPPDLEFLRTLPIPTDLGLPDPLSLLPDEQPTGAPPAPTETPTDPSQLQSTDTSTAPSLPPSTDDPPS